MGRKRKGRRIDGWLVIDKAEGPSSNGVVGRARRALDAAKVGHGGTLDPLASGLLPLAFGEATKTVSYVMDGAKTYRFEVTFGESRSTDDREGEVTATCDHLPTKAEIRDALPGFVGEIEQIPPAFSAIKVDGERAYKLARADEEVELKARRVRVDRFELLSAPAANRAVFEVDTGKGVYVRALARDLAKAVGTVGFVSMLRRTRVGPFTEKDAISLEELEESLENRGDLGDSAAPSVPLLPIETVLADIPALALTEMEVRRLQQGQALTALTVVARQPSKSFVQGVIVQARTPEGRVMALARIEGGEIRPMRVLNI
ncbi:MAG: tRNA pseudouridine(55) synthase TruB [Magnetovibrionaceae bacterium]